MALSSTQAQWMSLQLLHAAASRTNAWLVLGGAYLLSDGGWDHSQRLIAEQSLQISGIAGGISYVPLKLFTRYCADPTNKMSAQVLQGLLGASAVLSLDAFAALLLKHPELIKDAILSNVTGGLMGVLWLLGVGCYRAINGYDGCHDSALLERSFKGTFRN